MLKANQTVYTVNNKTNSVDTWTFLGEFPAKDGLMCALMDNRGRQMIISSRCVFETEDDAIKVINGTKIFN